LSALSIHPSNLNKDLKTMKKTILAFGVAAIAAIATSTGASAFSAPAGLKADDSRITPVTWWYGHDYYKPYDYGYGRHYGWHRYGWRDYGWRDYGWKRYHYGYFRPYHRWYKHRY
jgi:hypothetical protein